ncbi:MAG: disulfide bond formation protein B [Rhodobacteraceae bacterium]|nr:disulfide bond formation protein B [Paracoccaceae bacterium]
MTTGHPRQHWRPRPWRPTALLALAIALAVIVGAWGFQIIGGLAPCPLCLIERIPYYVGIPVGAIGLAVAGTRMPAATLMAKLAMAGFLVAMLVSTGLAAYHAGVEWGFWAGPTTCTGAGAGSAGTVGDLINQLEGATVVRCDEAPIRILGLSLAGWNVLASLAAAGLAARAVVRMP